LRIGMTVEINIVFREKQEAILVPNEAVANNAIEVVEDGRIRRVPVSLGVHGSRSVEVIGDVSPGALVVTPARIDLRTGSRVRSDKPAALASDATKSAQPSADDSASSTSSGLDLAARSVDMAISGALTAHMQSIVNDARKDASRN